MTKKVIEIDVKDARDLLEEKDPATLSDGEHLALALYYLGDVLGDALMHDDDDDDYDDDE